MGAFERLSLRPRFLTEWAMTNFAMEMFQDTAAIKRTEARHRSNSESKCGQGRGLRPGIALGDIAG